MGPIGRTVRGLAASSLLLTLVGAIPVALVAGVGWPLPREASSWSDMTATFAGDRPLDPNTVWRLLACIVWAAWAQTVVAIVVEAAAIARGRVAQPIRGFAHMQGLAAPLISAAALLLPSSFGHGGVPADALPASSARSLVLPLATAPAPAPPDPVVGVPGPPAMREHTVVRRDTLWDIAEKYLASGGSNDEIAAGVGALYALNVGVLQPDGMALTDASIIRPGWVLRIPADGPSGTPNVDGAPAVSVTVVPGDSLWEIADQHLDDGHRYTEVFDLNVGVRQADGHALTDPSLIEPGWRLELPGDDVASATPLDGSEAPTGPTTEPVTPSTIPTGTAPGEAPPIPDPSAESVPSDAGRDDQSASGGDDDQGADQGSTLGGALGPAGGLLAAGLAAVVAARHHRRRVRRLPGTEAPPLPADATAIVDAVGAADIEGAERCVHALRQLGASLRHRPAIPTPIVGSLDANGLELLLDRDDPDPPAGWVAIAGGRVWRADPAVPASDPDGPAWVPALVTLGTLEAGGVLLNVEGVGAVGLTGDPVVTRALAASMVVELAVTPMADVPVVHLVGDVLVGVGNVALDGLRCHADLASAVAVAAQEADGIQTAMAEAGVEDVFELRCRAPEEAWESTVIVFDARESDPILMRDLLAICATHSGIAAIVVGGCPGGVMEVQVDAETLRVPALGLQCAPQQLDLPAVRAIEALLAAAEAQCEPASDERPPTLFELPEADHSADSDSGPMLELRLLGPAAVEGVDLQPQQLALLAFLEVHPNATADAVREAVWGDKAPTRERFLNTVHGLRRAVGPEVLPSSTDGRYRLHRVWCDVTEFERLRAAADAEPDAAALHLRAALELVSGPPGTYDSRHRRHFRWVDLGNHASRWERVVGDAAHDLATLALASEDVSLARWAAERGLVASPANETLTCDLVAAHLAGGDRHAAELVVEAYGRVLEDLGCDESATAPQTLLERRQAS